MEETPNLKEQLLNKDPKDIDMSEGSINYFSWFFDQKNSHEGVSFEAFKKLKLEGFMRMVNATEKGLHSDNISDLTERRKKWGDNIPPKDDEATFFGFVVESASDPMLIILQIAALVSLLIGIYQEGLATGWIEGFSIFLAVFVVVTISSYQNYSKYLQFSKLQSESKKQTINVRRDNMEIKTIPVEELVVGDIVHLEIGDFIPCDGLLISDHITIDESSATGESVPFKKKSRFEEMNVKENSFLTSGTKVVDGSGKMLTLAVGPNSVEGKGKELLNTVSQETELQIQLDKLAGQIGDLGFIAAIFIGVVVILKEIIIRMALNQTVFNSKLLDVALNAFIISVTVIVVAIPEGLPMAVTISLAYSVFKMKDEHNLIKTMDAAETMGNVNNICTDKTGTLTKGEMEVRAIFTEGQDFKKGNMAFSAETKKMLTQALTNNISAYVKQDKGKQEAVGNPTECAMLNLMIEEKWDFVNLRIKEEHVAMLPFNSEYKMMAKIFDMGSGNYRLFIKGAPERIVAYCGNCLGSNGTTVKFAELKEKIFSMQEIYANNCYRTLGIGYKDLKASDLPSDFKIEGFENFVPYFENFTLIAMFGINDPPRDGVADSVISCKSSSVIVRMVTGDNIRTAIAIAKECKILNEEEGRIAMKRLEEQSNPKEIGAFEKSFKAEKIYSLEGGEFETLSGGYKKNKDKDGKLVCELNDVEKFRKVTENLKVIARASPDNKFLLVMGLRQLNNIVAVTGDGTNDAPALKNSDVGFAMGIRGTEVAKSAAKIILLNDSFKSIITAMVYGRNVYDSIRKFLQFQLTCNVVAVFMTLIGGVVLKDSPLNPIQMLWVNLIMDSFASLALATESPDRVKLLNRAPYPKGSSIITKMMLINIITQSIFQICVLNIIIFYGDEMFGVPSDREFEHYQWNEVNGYHFTIFFNIFVYLQIFNSINSRKLLKTELNIFSGILGNWLYLVIQLIILSGQVIMVTFGGRALRTHALSFSQHLTCMAIASLSLIVNFLVKMSPVGDDEESQASGDKTTRLGSHKTLRGTRRTISFA